MKNIEYQKVGEILSQHLQGKADPVYVTTAIPTNPIIDAFVQLFVEYDIKTEQEADLLVYYMLSQLELYLHSSYYSTLRQLCELFDVATTDPEIMRYKLLVAVQLFLTEKKLLLVT